VRRIPFVAVLLAALVPAGGSASAAIIQHPLIPAGHIGRAATQSLNWSGYAAYKSGTTFTDVKGSWVQPTASCPSRKKQYASFWLGIDGYNSSTVEQTGTDADCNGKNNPVYYAWYEFYPNPSVQISGMTITPGDTISAEVSASGTSFTLTITDVTTGVTFTKTGTVSSAVKTSAEWVAEAPALCVVQCQIQPLANFGTVNFSGSITTGNGHTGSISDTAWSNDSITMVTNGGTIKAQPSALSSGGQAFSVTWFHS
jgi:Peptidase A4 family